MFKKKFQLGFLGGGVNSTIGNIHNIASKLDSRWILASGFFSRDKTVNLESARSYGVSLERTYYSLENFIKNEKKRIDAVAVLVPTPARYKYILKLLKNNIPIISEKPLVDNFNQCINLQKILTKDNFLRVTYNYVGYPLIRELKCMIDKNYFGRIKQIHFEIPQDAFTFNTSKKINPKKWRLKDGYIPNVSHDLGSHLLSLSSYLLREFPNKVMCNYFQSSQFKNLIDNGYFWLNFKSGIKGTFWISKSIPGIRNGLRLRIFGDKKGSEWLQTKPEELNIYNESGSIEKIDNLTFKLESYKKKYSRYKVGHPAGFLEAFANLYYDYADQLDSFYNYKEKSFNQKKVIFDIKNSVYISKFFNAATKSNKTNKWIKVI
jgi:predicted dehydrogenase